MIRSYEREGAATEDRRYRTRSLAKPLVRATGIYKHRTPDGGRTERPSINGNALLFRPPSRQRTADDQSAVRGASLCSAIAQARVGNTPRLHDRDGPAASVA